MSARKPDREQAEGRLPSRWFRSRWFRYGTGLLVGFTMLAAFLPSLIGHTFLRDWLLSWLAGPATQISTRSLSLGWTTPLRVEGLAVNDLRAGSRIEVERIAAEQSWWRLLTNAPHLGSLVIDRPRLDLVVGRLPGPADDSARQKPTFRAVVRHVSVLLRGQAEQAPVIDLRDVDVTVQVAREAGGRFLTVEPTQLLHEQELTVEMCHRGLELIAPVLANTTQVDGKVSLRLDKLRVPLDQALQQGGPIDLDGHLVLHRVSAGLRNPLLAEIARTVATLLRTQLPSQVRIADEADVHFFAQDGRVFHDGLAFGLPEVSPELVIRTSGSVGLDRSLDMLVFVPVPLNLVRDGPILRKLSERPLQFQVRGTLDKPVLSLTGDRQWYEELAERLLPPAADGGQPSAESALQAVEPLADAVLDAVGDLLARRRQRAADKAAADEAAADEAAKPSGEKPSTTPLLDRFRLFRDGRRQRSEPPPP